MKKIAFITALLLTILSANVASAQLRYGLQLGGSIARPSLSDAPAGYAVKGGSGFSGGLALEYQLPRAQWFAVDIAALYTRYSYRMTNPAADNAAMRRNFIEVPLHFKFKYWVNAFHQLVAPMVYTGPSVMATVGSSHEPMATRRVHPAWDLGIGIDAANILQLQAGYRFSLANSLKANQTDMSLDMRGWHVSATLFFDF